MVYTNIAKQKLLLVILTIFNPIFEYIIILNIFFKKYIYNIFILVYSSHILYTIDRDRTRIK